MWLFEEMVDRFYICKLVSWDKLTRVHGEAYSAVEKKRNGEVSRKA